MFWIFQIRKSLLLREHGPLLEEDQTIEQNLIDDLLREVDFTRFRNLAKSILKNSNRVPDEETDLYFLADTMRRSSPVGCEIRKAWRMPFTGSGSEASWSLRSSIEIPGEICVRDARYNISAATFLGENRNTISYRRPTTTRLTGNNDVSVQDMVEQRYKKGII